MKVKKIDAFACPACGTIFENDEDAKECCFDGATEGYVCGECGELYDNKEEAKECCRE